MSDSRAESAHQSVLDDAWGKVVGGMEWLKSVVFGEFSDCRPLSAVVADMLVSFVPGVVIVTSARDAVAVILRLANHPEKREELMEWVLLSACLITIALPLGMAAGGAVVAGVGAVVGGIAGTELGAALRAVMLMLIKEASKLVELVQFLQKFIKGDILKFLRMVKFSSYEKALLQAINKVSDKLVEIVKTLRSHFESFRYFDTATNTIAKLAEWEKKFYAVQHDALKQIPRALAELDARLAKVLAQTVPKEMHTVTSGIAADKATATLPTRYALADTPGNLLAKVEADTQNSVARRINKKTALAPRPKAKSNVRPDHLSAPPPKSKPEPIKTPDSATNTKIQDIADATVLADRERISQISSEVLEAQKKGNVDLALELKEQARSILRPYIPKTPTDSWDEVVKRLDVSSPKDGAVFWSGDAEAAQKFAASIGGVTLETTVGGRIIDGWDEVNLNMAWSKYDGKIGPYARELWTGVSEKFAEGATGQVNTIQKIEKLRDTKTVWHNIEKDIISDSLQTGQVTSLNMYSIDAVGATKKLEGEEIQSLLKIKGTAK